MPNQGTACLARSITSLQVFLNIDRLLGFIFIMLAPLVGLRGLLVVLVGLAHHQDVVTAAERIGVHLIINNINYFTSLYRLYKLYKSLLIF